MEPDMTKTTSWLLRRLQREDGQTLVEYALIIMFVAIALVASLGALGQSLDQIITDIANNPAFGGS
jgi:Flp pilus assembly pilin Flp